MDMMTPTELEQGLRNFYGTETWFRHPLSPRMTYTEGVQFLAENAECYWLLDEIVLANRFLPRVKQEEFQSWKLKVNEKDHSAKLVCEDGGKDGNKSKAVYVKRIPVTDFPLPEIDIWVEGDVILLPSEH